MPYRNWGDLKINPERAGEISGYILRVVKPMWQSEYSMDIAYSVLNRAWRISGTVTPELVEDLTELELITKGNFRETSTIEKLTAALNNTEKVKRFIAGLTDTIGSLAPSHRNRTADLQVISYEFTGKNFILVSQIANLFIKIDCYPNQILWNHPNFQSGDNRYYRQWKKGFKIRIVLTDYIRAGSFVSGAKQLSAIENVALQKDKGGQKENVRSVRINGRSTLHIDENSNWLPDYIRGKHFVHNAHMAYFLGIPINGETLTYLRRKLEKPGKLISPFTILTKGSRQEINDIIKNEEYLRQSTYSEVLFSREQLKTTTAKNLYILGNGKEDGFPISQVIHAITYVGLAQLNQGGVRRTKISGNLQDGFSGIKEKLSTIGVRVMKPDRGTCLLIQSQDFAALVGYVNDDFNTTLTEIDHDTLAFKVREPKFSECVVL